MPIIEETDVEGNTMRFYDFQGKRFPPVPFDLDGVLINLPNLPAREDDVMILAYPKAGTHWVWEVANMLVSGSGEVVSTRHKEESMIEVRPAELVEKLPSVRLLNSHVTPDIYPTDLVKKKVKIVYILRNPKDIFVSYFHHVKKIMFYDYEGSWNGFFNVMMDGKNDYGSWFDFTKSWDKFFKEHPELPVLTLQYEELKKNLSGGVKQLADFLEVPCDKGLLENIVEKCTFSSMQKERGQVPEMMEAMIRGDKNPMYRKGIIGDWKNHFSVAQNERFDAEYKKQMAGSSFNFEQYMSPLHIVASL